LVIQAANALGTSVGNLRKDGADFD